MFQIGDKFTVDPALYPAKCRGVVYVVESLPRGRSGKNYVGRPASGTGQGVRAPEYAMRAFDGEAPAEEPAAFEPLPEVASIVRVRGYDRIDPSALYVVTGYPQRVPNAVRLVRVGGDGGRYWRAVPVSMLEVIEPDRITVA